MSCAPASFGKGNIIVGYNDAIDGNIAVFCILLQLLDACLLYTSVFSAGSSMAVLKNFGTRFIRAMTSASSRILERRIRPSAWTDCPHAGAPADARYGRSITIKMGAEKAARGDVIPGRPGCSFLFCGGHIRHTWRRGCACRSDAFPPRRLVLFL